jgi:PadR family transcriptional regulator, regulatory protein PadR
LPKSNNDVLQGTLDLLILKSLAQLGSMHGFGILSHIQRASEEFLRVEEGSLYPALHRIEQLGWIASEWGTTNNNRRARYYKLTPAGRRQLSREEEAWRRVVQGVAAVLRYA